MAAGNEEEETDLILGAVAKYRRIFVAGSGTLNLAPYGHFGERNSVPFSWGAYHDMLRDQGRCLANELNHFSYHIAQLDAWSQVLPDYEIEDQLTLLTEFVTPIATTATNLPYVIRARIIFSVSHLSHQANLITDKTYKEVELPSDERINYQVMRRISQRWPTFQSLSDALLNLSDDSFENSTSMFRNKYHHRYPPRFEHGHTNITTREMTADGKVWYSFGYTEPLKISELTPHLRQQHAHGRAAFDIYTALVQEHLQAIYAQQAGS